MSRAFAARRFQDSFEPTPGAHLAWIASDGNSPFPSRRYFPSSLSQQFKPALDELTRGGIYIGTSSWKYPGWCGQPYEEQRYLTRGKFSEAKFECECLAEYARTFSAVRMDFMRFRWAIHRSRHPEREVLQTKPAVAWA